MVNVYKGGLISKCIFKFAPILKVSEIIVPQLFNLLCSVRLKDSDLIHFDNKTKLKIPSEIKPPLTGKYVQSKSVVYKM